MSPVHGRNVYRGSLNDTQIACSEDDPENKAENGKAVASSLEEIPLKTVVATRESTYSYDDTKGRKIRQYFVAGCSCKESMKKMWTQLQLMENTGASTNALSSMPEQDEVDANGRRHSVDGGHPTHYDVPDQMQSTMEVLSNKRPHQKIPDKDVQKNAKTLRAHWGQLVQRMPEENTLLFCRAIEKKPPILEPFLEMLSECISFQNTSFKDGPEGETTIHMNMEHLLECPGENLDEFREAQLLLHLVDEIKDMQVKDEILAHPLITTFATLKYHKYRFVSVVLLIYHLLFATLFTNFAFHTFLGEHPDFAIFTKASSVVLTLMAVLSAIKTVTSFFASGLQCDLNSTRRLGEIFCAFVAFFMCLLPSFGYRFPFQRVSLNKDITAFGVMTSWLVLLSYLTKFNQTAVYVQTFFQVVKNYINFLWRVALCQLIALSATYSLIFTKTEPAITLTGNFSRSFIRVITGRMNYEDFTAEKVDFENPLSVFNYFFLFFVLSTVMMAMIIGLAQNSLLDTRSASAVSVLCQVIKDIAELEWLIWRLNPILPHKLSAWLVQKISIKGYLLPNTPILEIRPHNPMDRKIPKCLKKSIYNHLIDRGQTCHGH